MFRTYFKDELFMSLDENKEISVALSRYSYKGKCKIIGDMYKRYESKQCIYYMNLSPRINYIIIDENCVKIHKTNGREKIKIKSSNCEVYLKKKSIEYLKKYLVEKDEN